MEIKFKRGDKVSYNSQRPEKDNAITFLLNQKRKFKPIAETYVWAVFTNKESGVVLYVIQSTDGYYKEYFSVIPNNGLVEGKKYIYAAAEELELI